MPNQAEQVALNSTGLAGNAARGVRTHNDDMASRMAALGFGTRPPNPAQMGGVPSAIEMQRRIEQERKDTYIRNFLRQNGGKVLSPR